MELFSKILLYPYTLIIGNIASTIDSIKGDDGEEPGLSKKIFNILSLIPFAAGIVMFLITLISFIAGGGFVKEIEIVKSEGLGAVSSIWTAGNVGLFYIPWLCIAVGAVFLAFLVVAAIDLYKNATTLKKILFSVVAGLFVAIAVILICTAFNENVLGSIISIFGVTPDHGNVMNSAIIGMGIDLILAIVLSIMMSSYKPFVRCFINEVFYFAIAPVTGLIIINLIGLVIFAIVMVIIWVAGLILGNSLLGSDSGAGSSGSAPVSSGPSSAEKAAQAKKEAKEREENKRTNELESLYKQREEQYRRWDVCRKSNWDAFTCVNYGVTGAHDFERNIRNLDEKIKRLGGK